MNFTSAVVLGSRSHQEYTKMNILHEKLSSWTGNKKNVSSGVF